MKYCAYVKNKGIVFCLFSLWLTTAYANVFTVQCSDPNTSCIPDNLNNALSGKIKNMQTLSETIKFNYSSQVIFKSKEKKTSNIGAIPSYEKVINVVAKKIIDKRYPQTLDYTEDDIYQKNHSFSFSITGSNNKLSPNRLKKEGSIISSAHISATYTSAPIKLYFQNPFSDKPVIYTLSLGFAPSAEKKTIAFKRRFDAPLLVVKAVRDKPMASANKKNQAAVSLDHEQEACPLSLVSIMNNLKLERIIEIAKIEDPISRKPVDNLCFDLPGKHNYQSGHYWWLSADGKKISCIPSGHCSMIMPTSLQSETKQNIPVLNNHYNGIAYAIEANNQQQYSVMLKFTGVVTASKKERYVHFLIDGMSPKTTTDDNDDIYPTYDIGGAIDNASHCSLTVKTENSTVNLGQMLKAFDKEKNIYSTNPLGTVVELNAVCPDAIISPYVNISVSDFSTQDQLKDGIIELIADKPKSQDNPPLLLYLYTDSQFNHPLALTAPYKMTESNGSFYAKWYARDQIIADEINKRSDAHFRRINLELKYF